MSLSKNMTSDSGIDAYRVLGDRSLLSTCVDLYATSSDGSKKEDVYSICLPLLEKYGGYRDGYVFVYNVALSYDVLQVGTVRITSRSSRDRFPGLQGLDELFRRFSRLPREGGLREGGRNTSAYP